jgi:transcriptional regulator with XRE-family HTH domain
MKSMLAKSVMKSAQQLFEQSEMTLEELGQKMGHPPGTARRAVWQLFNKVSNPRLSTLESLAAALGVKLTDLLRNT